MQVSEEKLLTLIDNAIADAKARANGNKFHQGKCHGYAKALEQVQFAMTEKEDGARHLKIGVSR